MSLLIILMCFRGMADCTPMNAPLVLRSELSTKECERQIDRFAAGMKAGYYTAPSGGWYSLRCEPVGPKA